MAVSLLCIRLGDLVAVSLLCIRLGGSSGRISTAY